MSAESITPAASVIVAKHALTVDGWQSDVMVTIDEAGLITRLATGADAKQAAAVKQSSVTKHADILLPAMPNLHSHAFQRAMAGMTEMRGSDPQDSFWSWRKLMYRFLDHLTPDDVEAIAAFGQMEMLESGYSCVGEFHYLHHQPDGKPYANKAEMCERLVAAAQISGIGITLLPVLYQQGGCDGRALVGGQKRFGNTLEQFTGLFQQAEICINRHANNANIGIAPHSLRAVSQPSLHEAVSLVAGRPFHIHIAEQQAEVDELISAYGARPVEWLLDNHDIDNRWCLIHATQMVAAETRGLAKSGAVAGLCPVTESNLGDGIFDGADFQLEQGSWGVGTDSNVRITLSEELRTLEYSQRLRDKCRVVYATTEKSNGRVLYDEALRGGAQALQRNTGCIAKGYQADLLALDLDSPAFIAVEKDNWLDAWIFASDDTLITDVWSCGKHVVMNGTHRDRNAIETRYRQAMTKLCHKL